MEKKFIFFPVRKEDKLFACYYMYVNVQLLLQVFSILFSVARPVVISEH